MASSLLFGISYTNYILMAFGLLFIHETQNDLEFRKGPVVKEMAAHSSVLAWRIPGTGEPGGLPSMGSHRVRHD